uniref:Uncharacterized protein n=1 Tax=Globodera rostochiensis TaxID=31243 RepID=A0A914GQQ8_GLORO
MEGTQFTSNNLSANLQDLVHLSTLDLYRETLFSELQHIKAMILHKHNELNVYKTSNQLIGVEADECLVFLGDNLFVMRKNDIATAILQRKIQSFTIDLHKLEDERKALEIELFAIESRAVHSFAGGSLIDICEHLPGNSEIQQAGKRIAHVPTKKRKMAEEERAEKTDSNEKCQAMPKNVSEKDYVDFLNLLDSLNMSGEESCEDTENKETQGTGEAKRRVHFVKGAVVTHSAVEKKSILRNRNERSPIDTAELQRMCKRGLVQFLPTSRETLTDVVIERKDEKGKANFDVEGQENGTAGQ